MFWNWNGYDNWGLTEKVYWDLIYLESGQVTKISYPKWSLELVLNKPNFLISFLLTFYLYKCFIINRIVIIIHTELISIIDCFMVATHTSEIILEQKEIVYAIKLLVFNRQNTLISKWGDFYTKKWIRNPWQWIYS